MDASTLCSLATVWPGGRAHINHMYFAWNRQFEVFWISDPDSRHSRNLAANSSAAITIYDSHQTWGRPDRGIQLFGTAGRATGGAVTRGNQAYRTRFPSYDSSARDAYPVYRFRPRAVKLFYERLLGSGTLVSVRVTRDGLSSTRTDVFA